MKRTLPDDVGDRDPKLDGDKDEENYQKRDQEWESDLISTSSRLRNDGAVPLLMFPFRFFPYTLRLSDDPGRFWRKFTTYPRYILHRLGLLKVSILDSSLSYKECKYQCFSEFSHLEYIDPRFMNAHTFLNLSLHTFDGHQVAATARVKESTLISSSSSITDFRRRFYNDLFIVGVSRAPWSIPTESSTSRATCGETLLGYDKSKGTKVDINPLSIAVNNSPPSDSNSNESIVSGNDSSPSHDYSSSTTSSSSMSIPMSIELITNNEKLIAMGLSYENEGSYHHSILIWQLLLNRGHHYGFYKIGVRYLYGWNVRRCIDTAIYLFECSALASTSITPGLVYFLYTRHIDRFCTDGIYAESRLSLQCSLMMEYLVSEMIKSATDSPLPLKIKSLAEVCLIPPPSNRFDADILFLLMYLLFMKMAPSSHYSPNSEIEKQSIDGLLMLSASPRCHPLSAFVLAFSVYGASGMGYYNAKKSLAYYKYASDGGLVEASTLLGRAYEIGYLDRFDVYNSARQRDAKLAFPIDLHQSHFYYQLAFQRGDIESEEGLKRVRSQLKLK